MDTFVKLKGLVVNTHSIKYLMPCMNKESGGNVYFEDRHEYLEKEDYMKLENILLSGGKNNG